VRETLTVWCSALVPARWHRCDKDAIHPEVFLHRVVYQGVDTCAENAGTLPGDFTRKRCFE
jgi:hypothetical protein